MNGPRVLAIIGEPNGCSLWRTFSPFRALQERGFFAHWKLKDDPELVSQYFTDRLPFAFDAVLLPRLSWSDWDVGDRYIRALHKAGMAVIYEVDDDAFSPGIVGRQYTVHDQERAKGWDQLEQDRLDRIHVLQQVDGVTVTNRRLATIIRQYTDKPVEIVPNAIDTQWFRTVLHGVKRAVPPLTIGWVGGARYTEDLTPVAQAWGRIAKRYPDVRFVLQGHISEALADAVPEDRLHAFRWQPLETYPQPMLNVDIGCCAVAPKLFNTAKTPIKLWEMTMAGAVCVVSPTLYGPVVTDGEDALIAETVDEWEAALARLIDDQALRRALWRNQRRRVAREHSMQVNWWRWPAAWQSIIEQFRVRPRLAVA